MRVLIKNGDGFVIEIDTQGAMADKDGQITIDRVVRAVLSTWNRCHRVDLPTPPVAQPDGLFSAGWAHPYPPGARGTDWFITNEDPRHARGTDETAVLRPIDPTDPLAP